MGKTCFLTFAPGQSRLTRIGTRIVRDIDIIVISICGGKPLSSTMFNLLDQEKCFCSRFYIENYNLLLS